MTNTVRPENVPTSCFLFDGPAYVPTAAASGPWGETVSGVFVGGLLAHEIQLVGYPHAWTPLRFTVDLLRPVPLNPLTVETTIVRDGRRLRLIDADLLQNGMLVARASGSFARTGHQPYDVAPKTDATIPPTPILPKSEQWKDAPFLIWAFGTERTPKNPSVDVAGWMNPGRRYAWIYQNLALIEGFELTPFVRAARAGDVTSSLTHHGPSDLRFINPDYSVTFSRPPQSDFIGFASTSHHSHAGVATGSAIMFDAEGPIGSITATALSATARQ